MAKVKNTYDSLIELATRYRVEDNALFIASAKQYAITAKVLEDIQVSLEEDEGLMVEKEYVKSRKNVYANPLIKELPKINDSANRLLNTMLDIILKLGKEPSAQTRLEKMMDE
jgi:hypothetical protein